MWLRFAGGQPVSGLTPQFLAWSCDKITALGKDALVLIWDNASWHKSAEVRRWIHAHNQITVEGKRNSWAYSSVRQMCPEQNAQRWRQTYGPSPRQRPEPKLSMLSSALPSAEPLRILLSASDPAGELYDECDRVVELYASEEAQNATSHW